MKESSFFQSFAQVRRQVIELCRQERFASAQLLLVGSGLEADTHPGLWEYVARRSIVAGNDAVAQAIRRTLWDSFHRSGDLAMKEAAYHLDKNDYKSCSFVIEAVFGQNPTNQEARRMLARCYLKTLQSSTRRSRLRINRDAALRMADGLDIQTAEDAMTIIDLLRFSGALDKALEQNRKAQVLFPDDFRFVRRQAQISEQTGNLDLAIDIWQEVAKNSVRYRTDALYKLFSLNTRLERPSERNKIAAELTLEGLTIAERLRLAMLFGQQDVVQALAEFAGTGGPVNSPISHEEGSKIGDMLLDNGDIGLLVWLRRQRMHIGTEAKQVLDASGFGVNGDRHLPDSFLEATRLRSPDFMVPLEKFLEQDPKPAGWPGVGRQPEKLLLVNASLAAGGAERQFVELIRSLIQSGMRPEGIEVAFYSLAQDRGHAHFLPELETLNVKIHDLLEHRVNNPNLPSADRTLIDCLPAGLRDDVRALWHLVKQCRPQALHGWQDRAALACGITGVLHSVERVVLSTRNMSPSTRREQALLPLHALYRDFADKGNFTLTANSKAGARDYANWLDCPEEQVQVLSNSVDTRRFSPAVLHQRAKSDKNQPLRISGIFRLSASKRPMLWLRTVAALRHDLGLSLVPRIFGRGPLEIETREQAAALGLDDLTIESGLTEPADLYGNMDVLLLMSRVEGTPNVILEAQACGLPVAACDVGGVSEALYQRGRGTGLLLAADINPSNAADQLAKWLPGALSGPHRQRIAFVRKTYGTTAFAEQAKAIYSGTIGALK